jgi:hypothetical protein
VAQPIRTINVQKKLKKIQTRHVERTIDKAPEWMTKLPESKSAVYANGSGVSREFSMADEKAKLIAFSKVCMAAGGEVDKQSKMFLSDTEDTSTERSELAVRSTCRGVDIFRCRDSRSQAVLPKVHVIVLMCWLHCPWAKLINWQYVTISVKLQQALRHVPMQRFKNLIKIVNNP